MATGVKASKRVNHERLVRFVQAAFEELGVPNADAQIGADALVAADLRGVDTHGVIRFNPQAWYVNHLTYQACGLKRITPWVSTPRRSAATSASAPICASAFGTPNSSKAAWTNRTSLSWLTR